jgi:hypothetical protein
MSSHAIFIIEVLITAMYLANPELDRSKCISILSKLQLKSLYNIISIGFLIIKKSGNYSLIILYPECLVNIFERTGWENNYGIDRRVEIDSINLIFQAVYSLKMISCEIRNPELCVRCWYMYLWIKRYWFKYNETREIAIENLILSLKIANNSGH